MATRWITKKSKDGKNRHIPITEGNRVREKEIRPKRVLDQKLENLHWYTETEYGYSDVGVDEAEVYKTEMCYKGNCYEITVYPLELIDEDLEGWDYKIYTLNKNGEILDEYDAGVGAVYHFSTSEEAKGASISTLKEMLEG
ncbi:MAG: hypothetical protein RXO36_07560 [Candidatus Nanopusillus acidilobi]